MLLVTLSGHEWANCREMTPRRLALGAARLMLQQQLWGRATAKDHSLGQLTLLDSLCVAAGGNYTEDGVPAPPDEPQAAAVLATTCRMLAQNAGQDPAFHRLDELRAVSDEDNVTIQRLLATVHGSASQD